MILNSNNTYTGATTINGGNLEVNGSILASATVTINSGGFLSGTGTINGGVAVQSGGTLTPGSSASIGTLTISNGLTFNAGSTNAMRIYKTGTALNCDLLQRMTSVNFGGTLTVMATGDALTLGDTFRLFDSSHYGGAFATNNLPALASDLAWDLSQLTINGVIQVVNVGYVPPPPLTNLTVSVSGNVASLSWPIDQTGWILQVQTNDTSGGLSTNWVDVPDATLTNKMALLLNSGSSCVFYRLVRPPIDRYALVTRHNIQWNSSTGTIPLGNGEFCFNADGTGLQTFGGNSMSHWAWHSFPLPAGVTADQIPATGTFATGRVQGEDDPPSGTDAIETWIKQNPHIMNLGRLQLCDANGTALTTGAISGLARTMNLWSGAQTSSYQVNGQTVTVETCVHPVLDAVVVRIQSPLIASGALQVALDFPYPALANNSWVGNFSQTSGNTTALTMNGGSRADFVRTLDTTNYDVSLTWSPGGKIVAVGSASPNRFLLSAPGSNTLEFICVFSNAPVSVALPTVAQSLIDTSNHWANFWSTGGAIDLSRSKDSRWFELERRIVLSQYELAAQDAGSWAESENGLMGIDPWVGQFHMEMLWWHLAHYALWDRWDMLTNALPYQRFVPQAQALAAQLGYKGLKWPKEIGPEGRTAPWIYNQVLLWKQPHPIFFAELDYRLHPTRAQRWRKWTKYTFFGTADHVMTIRISQIKAPALTRSPSTCRPAKKPCGATRFLISRIGVGDSIRHRSGDSASPSRAIRFGTRSSYISRRCRCSTVSLLTTRETLPLTPPPPMDIPIPLAFMECFRPSMAWMRILHTARVLKLWTTWDWNNSPAGAGIFPGWPWPPRAQANHRSPWRRCSTTAQKMPTTRAA